MTLLELQVLTGSGVRVALDEPRAGNLDARSYPPDEALLEDGRDEHLVGDDLLDLAEQGLALLPVELLGLAREEMGDLRKRAVRVEAALGDERLEPSRRVARGAGRADEEPLQLLLGPRGHVGRALHRPHSVADPEALEIASHRLAQRSVGRKPPGGARLGARRIASFR